MWLEFSKAFYGMINQPQKLAHGRRFVQVHIVDQFPIPLPMWNFLTPLMWKVASFRRYTKMSVFNWEYYSYLTFKLGSSCFKGCIDRLVDIDIR